MPWPSLRRWNRNNFIRLFHIATFITPAHKLFPVSLSTGKPTRRCHRQNNTSRIPAGPEVPAWHLLTSKLQSTHFICSDDRAVSGTKQNLEKVVRLPLHYSLHSHSYYVVHLRKCTKWKGFTLPLFKINLDDFSGHLSVWSRMLSTFIISNISAF